MIDRILGVRRLAVLLLVFAALEVPWLITLGLTLRSRVHVRMWSTAWVGLDCIQVVGLVVTAILLLRRNAAVIPVAAATGAVFLVDAWFDLMLSPTDTAWWVAVATASCVELPIAALCARVAWRGTQLMLDRRTPPAAEGRGARGRRGA